MTDLRAALGPAAPSAVATLRPTVPDLVGHMVAQIQADVRQYAGPTTGRRYRLMSVAISGAVHHFLDLVERGPHTNTRVDDLFRRMGHGEASEERDLTEMRTAFRVATRDAWENLRQFAEAAELSVATLGHLGDALYSYIDHLTEQTQIGFDLGRRASDALTARRRLARALTSGASVTEIDALIREVGWTRPDRIVALAIDVRSAETPEWATDDLELDALIDPTAQPYIALVDADAAEAAVAAVQAAAPAARLALSEPVAVADVPTAHAWARRALDLAARGVISPAPVLTCRDHRTQLWLHAEPLMRRQLCQDLLTPLLAETPNSREILSETLLAWLESRDSAPAIAARLGVHPQTIRYRWKRINELFGEDLHDPEFVVQVTMVLKATVPLWKAGDHADVERYHAEEATR